MAAMSRSAYDCAAAPSQLTCQGTPKRSTNMPNRAAQNVCSSGITTVPPLARSPKTRSASATVGIWSESEKPFGAS